MRYKSNRLSLWRRVKNWLMAPPSSQYYYDRPKSSSTDILGEGYKARKEYVDYPATDLVTEARSQIGNVCERPFVRRYNDHYNYRFPTVMIASECLKEIARRVHEFRQTSYDETGFALIGHFQGTGLERKIYINSIIEAGPNSQSSAGHVSFDRKFQQQELNKLELVYPAASHVGDIHLHPGSYNICSTGDYRTDSQNVRNSVSQEMVFGIITAEEPQYGYKSFIMPIGGLNFNFYYLGKESNYQYWPLKPVVYDAPLIQLPELFKSYLKMLPHRAMWDFKSLSSMFRNIQIVDESDGKDARIAVYLSDPDKSYQMIIHIYLHEAKTACPHVFIVRGDDIQQFKPDFMNQPNAHLIWLTQIVIEAEKSVLSLPTVKFVSIFNQIEKPVNIDEVLDFLA